VKPTDTIDALMDEAEKQRPQKQATRMTARVELVMTEADRAVLDRIAAVDDRSVGYVIRKMIRREAERLEREQTERQAA